MKMRTAFIIVGAFVVCFFATTAVGFYLGMHSCKEVIKRDIRTNGFIELDNEVLYGQIKKKPSILPY